MMIADDGRPWSPERWAEEFEKGADEMQKAGPKNGIPLLMHETQIAAMRSMAEDLREQARSETIDKKDA